MQNFVKSESYNINGYERIGTVFNPISKLPKTVKRQEDNSIRNADKKQRLTQTRTAGGLDQQLEGKIAQFDNVFFYIFEGHSNSLGGKFQVMGPIMSLRILAKVCS